MKKFLKQGFLVLCGLVFLSYFEWLQLKFGQSSTKRNKYEGVPQIEKETQVEIEYRLPKDVVSKMLDLYNDYAGIIKPEDNKSRKLLFAFVSDNDMVVNAVELMKKLECQDNYPANYHRSLSTKKEICETIAFFFTRGLGSELYIGNGTEFKNLITLARVVKKKDDLGGNSAQMALRGFKEGADVYLHSMMSHEFYKTLYNSSITVVPSNLLREEIRDVHLVIDFTEGETYGSLNCSRTNRLFLQSDRDNMQFPGIDVIDTEVLSIKPDVFVISGFQLMNQREIFHIYNTMSTLSEKIDTMNRQMPNLKFHFEMGAFTDKELMKQIMDKIFYKIHSTGMNEQELIMLVQYYQKKFKLEFLETGFIDEGDILEDDMSTNGLIKKVIKLIQHLTKDSKPSFERYNSVQNLFRIHFHSSNFQMLCSTQNWANQKFSLVRSILVGLIQAMKTGNDNKIDSGYFNKSEKWKLINFQPLLTFLPSIDYKTESYSFHELDPDTMQLDDLVRCWNVKQNMQCCIAPTLIHLAPERTCGLGDNIAATSLLYQIKQKSKNIV